MKTKKINVVFSGHELVQKLKKAKKGEIFYLDEEPIKGIEDLKRFQRFINQLIPFQHLDGFTIRGVLSFTKVKRT